MTLNTILKCVGVPLLVTVAAVSGSLEARADHDEYASYVIRSRRASNPQGILHSPQIQNGAAKIDGPKPFIGGKGFIEVGFSTPVYNNSGVDLEVNHTNGGVYDVYALAPEGYWIMLGRHSGRSYVDLGHLPLTTAIRIENITLMKNILIDWVRNRHPTPEYYYPQEDEE